MKKNMLLMFISLVLIFSTSAVFAQGGAEKAGAAAAVEAQAAPAQVTADDAPETTLPQTLVERFSYAFGYMMTKSYAEQGVELDPKFFAEAIDAANSGLDPLYTDEEMNAILMEYQGELMAKQEALAAEEAAANLEKVNSFLETNKTRAGVMVTESGLQYEVVAEGDGPKPTEADTVTVHYRGTLLDGTEFDSSYSRNEPATFPLNAVITGWIEGLQLMSVGSTYRFYISPELGYGEAGAGGVIGPNELLIFEVELLGIGEEAAE